MSATTTVLEQPARTLVEALDRLPTDPERGMRFIGTDRTERYYSFQQLGAESRRRAALLQNSGLSAGNRVGLVIQEGHEFVLTMLGVVLAGGVPVPIFPKATFKASSQYTDSVAQIIEGAGARWLLTASTSLPLVVPVMSHSTHLRELHTVEALFSEQRTAPEMQPPEVRPEDPCFLQFTSGSTSHPKGVTVTHANLIANTSAFLGPSGLDRRDDDLGVSWLPLFHDMGLIGFVLGPLIHDIPVVLLPTTSFARGPRVWLETITRFKGTITYAPNFAYALATRRMRPRDLQQLDLRSLRVAGCGAEPIQADTLQKFSEALETVGLRPEAMLPSYGMAESTLAITFHPIGTAMVTDEIDPEALRGGRAEPVDRSKTPEAPCQQLVSNGVPFPGHQIAIVDEDGGPLPERQVGQIIARGPSVSPGYHDNPEANGESFRPDGWLYTGDLGYLADGNLYVCGRQKDLIIIRGANFHAQDLEWSVSDVKGVRRGNVVAFGSQVAQEERLVVAVECHSQDVDQVRTEVEARISKDFGLTAHEVVAVPMGTLPKTSSGKAQRNRTRTLYEQGELDMHHH